MARNCLANPIHVGVVGCGNWGPNLARNFAALPECRLVAVCDRDPIRLNLMRSLYPGSRMYSEFSSFVEDDSIEAVAIATDVSQHYPIGRDCLLAGKHACIEKPMASSSSECLELDQIARERGLVLMAGHTFRYSPPVRKMKEIVLSGEIGQIRHISARRLNLGLFQKDINVAWDLAPHDLSILLYLLNEPPIRVSCLGAANFSPGRQDIAAIWLSFADNRSALIQNSWLDPRKTLEITVIGTQKSILYDDLAVDDKVRVYDSRVVPLPGGVSGSRPQYTYHNGNVTVPHVNQEEPLRVECQHFLDCIRDGTRPITDTEHAIAVVRILEAASESLAAGGLPVDLDPEEAFPLTALRPKLDDSRNPLEMNRSGRIDE